MKIRLFSLVALLVACVTALTRQGGDCHARCQQGCVHLSEQRQQQQRRCKRVDRGDQRPEFAAPRRHRL